MFSKAICWLLVACGLSLAGLHSVYAQEEGLVGYWNFDEGFGGIAYDKSGKENNGKITGAKYVKEGKGYALQFSNSAANVDCGNSASLNMASAFTMELWVKSPLSDIRVFLIRKTAAYSLSLFETPGPDNLVNLYAHTYSATRRPNEYYLSKGLSLGQWYQVAMTWNGTDVKGYVNGEYTGFSLPTVAPLDTNTNPVWIGGTETDPAWIGGTEKDGLSYTIDEVRIYNRVLSDGEIKKYYEDTKGYFAAAAKNQAAAKE